jgi:hypothetical protein
MSAKLVLVEPDREYRVEVIAKLKDLLAAARDGQILSIVYACELPAGRVTTGMTRIKDRYTVLGELAYMSHRTCQWLDEDAEESDVSGEA